MTLLVASVFADDVETLQRAAEAARTDGADAVEARLDTFAGDLDELTRLLNQPSNLTWIVTCRPPSEGGRFAGRVEQRVTLLATLARETDAYLDFELADWISSSDVRQQLARALASRGAQPRLILSLHDFEGMSPDLEDQIRQAHAQPEVASAKVAFQADDATAGLWALDLMRNSRGPLVAVAMGEAGVISRVLARKCGAWASYASLDGRHVTAPGQLSVRTLKELYRWDALDESTRVFGVIGALVSHSMSPALFGRWFAEAGINAVFLPLHVAPNPHALDRFLDACLARPWLDLGGCSVTLPHKTAALRYLGQGNVDDVARKIGAVNTLTVQNDHFRGCNTDCPAALASLRAALTRHGRELAGITADVLGTGGAARALVAGLVEAGCAVTIYGRDAGRTEQLAGEFNAQPAAWSERAQRRGVIVVNCTNVGMAPKVKASPLPAEGLAGCELVFDVIYNPPETALLRQASRAEAAILGGLDMFIRQAALQFERWTGQSPDLELGRQLVTARLTESETEDRA